MRVSRILLASNSPRRREMLGWTGLAYRVQACGIDESAQGFELPGDYALRLAESKGRAAENFAAPDEIILASDTIVALGNDLLGKPLDHADAAVMLTRLRGSVHQVYTAICLYQPSTGKLITDLAVANVTMRHFSDAEMEAYIASGDPFDKAGAYAIQHPSFQPAVDFNACYACVMGMPLCHLERSLWKFGMVIPTGFASACQSNLAYDCPVYADIMEGKGGT